jgi:hypothetical protein
MQKSLIISLFSFLLSFFIALIYWLVRFGYIDNSFFIIVKLLGTSAFILLLPYFLNHLKKYTSSEFLRVVFNDTIVPFYSIILIAITGYIHSILNINLSSIFIIFGFIFLCICIYSFWRQIQLKSKVILILIAAFFASWVGSVCWMMYLKPSIIEAWLCGEYKIDTVFHLSIAQMLKTYGIPSTGLDGVPYMNYHWGSHWIFAQFSNFLDVPVVVIYQLVFPAIIAPLLFRSFLSFVVQVKQHYKVESGTRKLNFLFWIVFLSVFIGFIINFLGGNSWAQFSSGGTGLYLFMLLSESYTLSIILMLGLLSTYLNFWIYEHHLTSLQKAIILIFLLPILVAILGFIKISTWYVVCCLLGYLFLRIQLFKNVLWLLNMVLLSLTVLIMYNVVYESKENHGTFEFLYFYKSKEVSIVLFIILFYIWTHIFLFIYIYKEKLFSQPLKQLLNSKKLLPVECILVVSIVGFLPTVFFRIQSFDSLYFTEIQMWISSALVLSYIPMFTTTDSVKSSRKKMLLIYLPCVLLFAVFFYNTRIYWRNFWAECSTARRCVLGKEGNLKKHLAEAVLEFKLEKIPLIIEQNKQQYAEEYRKNKVLSFLQKLKALDELPREQKSKTLVYIDLPTLTKDSRYDWKLPCYNIAFIVPSLAGMASIDGIDVTYDCGECCENNGYSYQYYPKWKNYEQLKNTNNKKYLCSRAYELGFESVMIYNLQTESFEQMKCR